jgi:hypothetical protein
MMVAHASIERRSITMSPTLTGSSAWAEHDRDLWPEGATGSPTRAFVRFIERTGGGSLG